LVIAPDSAYFKYFSKPQPQPLSEPSLPKR
jgi:hypothetical protein